ncbi:MAG: heme exporter protein CcmD [Nevskiaceae bacterium]|nr:MAG: heme exporter protein CcmD [Nevskiaceae bacterium]TBR74158.1 MAG: heme exporter protein CcmD [Nevskiaceae bacterium]
MGGFAFYVWSSFGLAVLVLVWNVLAPRLRHTAVLRELSTQDDTDDTASRSGADGLRRARS